MEKNQNTPAEVQRVSFWADLWRDFKKNRGAVLGMVLLFLIVIVAVAAHFLIDYEEQIIAMNISEIFQKPSREHLFGTDSYGRDIFLRLLYGAQYSLVIGTCSVLVSLVVGSGLGVIAGYFGGAVEMVIMRIMDVFSPIPGMLLAICLTTAFGRKIYILMLAIGITAVPAFAQVARASVMTIRDQEFIEAARTSGAREYQIIFSHVLPNAFAPILVQATLQIASAIIAASGLSFLGLGVPVPIPEWGAMLSDGRSFMRDYSYMTFFPGLAIMITVLSINMIGDGLRDAMDPRLKR